MSAKGLALSVVSVANAKVLVVDDDELILELLQSTLSDSGYTVFTAEDGETAERILDRLQPDIVMLDIYMPGMSGIELCRRIKRLPRFEQTPILFMTGSDDEVRSAYESGGVDYVVKPLKINQLLARITTHVKMSRLMSSLEEANQALESLNVSLEDAVKERTLKLTKANDSLLKEMNQRKHLQERLQYLQRYDFVTRMLNRSAMEEQLAMKLQSQTDGEETEPWFLLYIDLDRFRVINNTCGHAAGDEFLRTISNQIKNVLHVTDVSARMGGDEFAFLYQCPDEMAEKKAKDIKETIESYSFQWEGESFKVGASLGLVELDSTITGVAQLVSAAEHTCRESKLQGGGELTSYKTTKAHIDQITDQSKWIPTIQSAIENGKFELYGQKISDSFSLRSTKLEVLIRLPDEQGNPISPAHFIPIAERYHLISDLDKWVVKEVIENYARSHPDVQFSVNLSGETIGKRGVTTFIESLLNEGKIEGTQICFEITETSAISNLSMTREFINYFRKFGCQFALDDFGTGTSSYGYLKQLPVDYLKIDGMFVRDLERERISRLMVESMAAIALEMGIKIVAECVESKEALEALKLLNVHFVQGYYVHMPEPLQSLLAGHG